MPVDGRMELKARRDGRFVAQRIMSRDLLLGVSVVGCLCVASGHGQLIQGYCEQRRIGVGLLFMKGRAVLG